jgi:hypothetical protein
VESGVKVGVATDVSFAVEGDVLLVVCAAFLEIDDGVRHDGLPVRY